jgi:hypothetical protein
LLSIEALKDLLHMEGISNHNRMLLCLAADPLGPRTIAQVIEIAEVAGLRNARTMNASGYLSRAKGLAIRTPNGWELTTKGKAHVGSITAPFVGGAVNAVATSLRAALASISDAQTRAFAEEAVQCFEKHLFRAAVVLSWVGAVAVLYDHVIANRLTDFNAEALKRDTKWKAAKTKDDLGKLKEYDFLQIIAALGIITKNVKEELEACLKFRNACGHPTSLKFGENRVSGHIETLILNVFSVF